MAELFPKKLAIVGGGTMGSAYVRCLTKAGLLKSEHILVIEADDSKLSQIRSDLNCEVSKNPTQQLKQYPLLILAVKPQDLSAACLDLKTQLAPNTLVISIAAGVTLNTLESCLGASIPLVRAMPNLGVQVGRGMTVYTCGAHVNELQLQWAECLFTVTGAVLRVPNEQLMDAATAVSGTGPGYLFYILQALIEVAVESGFSLKDAELLILETLKGSLEVLKTSQHTPKELVSRVASKGGTTEAALKVFNERDLEGVLKAGVRAALRRASELNR